MRAIGGAGMGVALGDGPCASGAGYACIAAVRGVCGGGVAVAAAGL